MEQDHTITLSPFPFDDGESDPDQSVYNNMIVNLRKKLIQRKIPWPKKAFFVVLG